VKVGNVLSEILSFKQEEVLGRKAKVPLAELEKRARDFELRDFKKAISGGREMPNLIAEIKKASPSKGLLREKLDIPSIVSVYERHAKAISVITDWNFFQGKQEYLREVKQRSMLPVLCKDFIVDDYQIAEARAFGADAVLLIAAALSKQDLAAFYAKAKKLGMDCLVEVHSKDDLEKAVKVKPEIIGINNRDLKTLNVDINTTLELAKRVPKGTVIVSESGFNTIADVHLVKGKADAVLIGSAFMKSDSIEKKIMEMGF